MFQGWVTHAAAAQRQHASRNGGSIDAKGTDDLAVDALFRPH
jgi:hypothetical protein